MTPTPEPLFDNAWATNGLRASGNQHLVQCRDADSRLGLSGGEAARS
jgi:hypothetical protein